MKVRARPGAPTTCCTSVLRRVLPISPSRRRSIHTITLGLRAACHRNAFFLFTAHKNTPYIHTPQRSPLHLCRGYSPLSRGTHLQKKQPSNEGSPQFAMPLTTPHYTHSSLSLPAQSDRKMNRVRFFGDEHRKQACSPVYKRSVLVRSRCTETKEHLRRCPPPHTSLRSACLTRMRCLFPFQPIFLLGGNGTRGKHITDDQRLLHILSSRLYYSRSSEHYSQLRASWLFSHPFRLTNYTPPLRN
jgi:hypothetical protein